MKSKNDIPHISPQSAMDDYFHDMFGSSTEDPLKKLEATERESQQKSIESETTLTNELVLKSQKKSAPLNLATQFADPEIKMGQISPLIIPAAFPKLAPAASEPVKKTAVKAKVIPDVKLDKKTALGILLKQKDKLTKVQRLKLKEKLKQLEAKKSVLVLPKTEVRKAEIPITKEKIFKPAPAIASTTPKTKTQTEALSPEPELVEKTIPAHTPEQVRQTSPAVERSRLPAWSERRFECLLFSVAGLKLAVPLVSLGAIYKIEKDFTPLVGRASWFMGLYHHLDRNVRVVDTAQWVMPERSHARVRENYKFIIRLGDGDWGMACDAVHQSIQLYPDQVKWRSERTKRVWLFGTVIEHMCALIDADALNLLLEQQAPTNILV